MSRPAAGQVRPVSSPKIKHLLMRFLLFLLLPFCCNTVSAQQWWRALDLPELDRLMTEAIAQNYDLRIAQERIMQARAVYRGALGALAPDITLSGGWTRSASSRVATERLLPVTYESYYDGRLSGTWTVDLFGHLRRAAEAKRAAYRAAQMDRALVLLTLSKEVAVTYLNLCATRHLIAVTEGNIASQREIARLTQVRYEAGLESRLDVTQALATLYNTEAGITGYRSDESSYLNQLATLLGTTPQRWQTDPPQGDSLPTVQLLLPDSIATEQLRQRPDLRQGEWLVDEQAALLGVARKEWLPQLLVDGSIGMTAHDLPELPRRKAMAWQVAPVLQWTVFDGGIRTAEIRQAKATLQAEVDNYNLLLLTAVQQVESALIAYREACQQVQALTTAVSQAEQSLQLSLTLYKQGLTAFINVVQAQQSVLQYQVSLVGAQNSALQQAVALWVAISPGVSE